MNKIVPITIEIVGLIGVSTGIGIELACHADIGYVVLTIGSTLVAAGGIIWGKFYRRLR